MNPKEVFPLIKTTFMEWSQDKAPVLAAALAYYTVFSLAPLLMILIAIVGLAFGQTTAQEQTLAQIERVVGKEVAPALQLFLKSASRPEGGGIAIVIGIATMLLGASAIFGQMKDALNTIWDAKPPKGGVLQVLLGRLIAFAMVLVSGVLLLLSVLVNTVLATLQALVNNIEGIPNIGSLWSLLNFAVSLAFITLIFAVIFKTVPDIQVKWNDVWLGAALTALLFNIGKSLIGLYMGFSGFGSTYGAAGAVIVVLFWVNYSAQIFLFGAEFTQVYTHKFGSLKQDE